MKDFIEALEHSSLSFCSVEHSLSDSDIICEILEKTRQLFNFEVAFISEFSRSHRIFRFVAASSSFQPINVGQSDPLEESYCQHVITGRLPQVIHNATQNNLALEISATSDLPIGAHMSVPIIFSDGRVFGTFCCFSREPNYELNENDLNSMRFIGMCTAKILERSSKNQTDKSEIRANIEKILDAKDIIQSVYQPFFSVAERKVIGYEALSRFSCQPQQTPDIWFSQAEKVSLNAALEIKAAEQAISLFFKHDINQTGCFLSVNLSPKTIKAHKDEVSTMLEPYLNQLVVEITEYKEVKDYELLNSVLDPLRAKGLRIAVDDAGAGFSSFRHILLLRPNFIKLDRSLISDIGEDTDKFMFVKALADYAANSAQTVIAEGVETESELNALKRLKVPVVQGFYLGRPSSLDAISVSADVW